MHDIALYKFLISIYLSSLILPVILSGWLHTDWLHHIHQVWKFGNFITKSPLLYRGNSF